MSAESSSPFIQPLETRILFTALPTSPLSSPAILLADLNGDGKADLITVGRTQTLRDLLTGKPGTETLTVQLGNGDGTYRKAPPAARASVDLTPAEFEAMCAGDVNNDGQPDLVLAHVDSAGRANGYAAFDVAKDGSLTQTQKVTWTVDTTGPVVAISDIAAADLDGDGATDLAIVYSQLDAKTGAPTNKPGVRVLWGIGGNLPIDGAVPTKNPTFTDFPLDANTTVDTIFTGDIDGDGHPDIVATEGTESLASKLRPHPNIVQIVGFAKSRGGTMSSVQNNPLYVDNSRGNSGGPSGSIGAVVTNFLSDFETVGLADLNGDGRADLIGTQNNTVVVSTFDAAKLIWSTRSNVFLYGSPRINTPPIFNTVVVGDVNGDGLADLELADTLANNLYYFQATKGTTFGVGYVCTWQSSAL